MKTQTQFLEEILQLKKEHPEHNIHFCVDSDDVLESGWTAHVIVKVEVTPWFCDDERIYVDDDEINELFIEQAIDNMTEQEAEDMAEKRYAEEVKMAICVYTRAG